MREGALKERPCLGDGCKKSIMSTPEKRMCDSCTDKIKRLDYDEHAIYYGTGGDGNHRKEMP